jgi:predicted aspartyl protease
MRSGSAWPGIVGAVAAWMILGPARASVPPEAPPPAVAPPIAAPPIAAPPTTAPGAGPEGDAAAENLPLAQDPSTRLTLAVMVDGKGPYAFLVDTGSDRTSISAELAAVLALPQGPKVIIHGSGGVDQARTVVIDSLTIGNRTLRHIEAPALAASNLGADGMLGVDVLRDLHLVMDFKALRLSSSPSRAEPVDEHTIVVRGKSRYGQLILANSKVHGVPVLVVLDSGSELSIGNPALLKLLTGHDTAAAPQRTTRIVTATGRHLVLELDEIAEAEVGGVTIRNMPLAFAQLHTFDRFGLTRQPALLLGMDVLSLCQKVTVDLRRREATFTLN